MKILVVGNAGYIGPILGIHLRSAIPEAHLIGFDSGLFAHCLTHADYLPEFNYHEQHWGDVRHFPSALLDGVDAVVYLAALSNDPMGTRFEKLTYEINHQAAVKLAQAAKTHGVKSFVFASSCSIYGYAEGGPRKETDALNPLTAYARSKVMAEKDLAPLADEDFKVTCLRFSTACGMSSRLRLDLVLNDFVAGAFVSKEIQVLSDGTPWRPLIDVKDMARAIEWALERQAEEGGNSLVVNVGSTQWNYQVKDLAQAAAEVVPQAKVSINKNAPPDKRSYRVDFSLFERLAPKHQPQVSLQQSVREIKEGLESMSFAIKDFRKSSFIRLKVLERHIEKGFVNENLEWKNQVPMISVAFRNLNGIY